MEKLLEEFVEDLFQSPAFRKKLQLWFTEAVSGLDIPTDAEINEVAEQAARDIIDNASFDINVTTR
jgi:hypothetical protein